MVRKDRVILGLDVGVSCIGVSLVKYDDGKVAILKISNVKTKPPKNVKGTESLFIRAKQFKEQFIEKHRDIGITDVIIEEPSPNMKNNETVSTLLRFNGMLSQSIYESTGIVPIYISSQDARKYAFPDLLSVRKYDKNDEVLPLPKIRESLKNDNLVLFGGFPFSCQKKYILWNKVTEMFPYIQWEYDSKGNLKTENFDASDSLICILGQLNKERFDEDRVHIIDYHEDDIKDIVKISYTFEFCGRVFEKSMEIVK